jgi:hypothetical protein
MQIYDDQVNSDRWLLISDYVWTYPNDGYTSKFDVPILTNFNCLAIKTEAVIFIFGSSEQTKDCFRHLPKNGKYIIITRDDAGVNHKLFESRPKSIKHWFAVNCSVIHPDITAIPLGLATINGFSEGVRVACKRSEKTLTGKRVFARFNVNSYERIKALANLDSNLTTVCNEQMNADDFYTQIKSHQFCLSPAGNGIDCLRTYEAMLLGSIPIVTDSIEMWHFRDMPIAFSGSYIYDHRWLDDQLAISKYKSTERLYMSYWDKLLQEKRKEIFTGIESIPDELDEPKKVYTITLDTKGKNQIFYSELLRHFEPALMDKGILDRPSYWLKKFGDTLHSLESIERWKNALLEFEIKCRIWNDPGNERINAKLDRLYEAISKEK